MALVARKEAGEVGSDVRLWWMAQQGHRLPYDDVDCGTKVRFRQEHDEREKRVVLWLPVAHRRQWRRARWC